jgi:hypothetical protein
LIADQLVPLFVDKKTPLPEVPAKILLPLMAIVLIGTVVRPELIADQLVPLLVDRKTPPLLVPAKTVLPLTASAVILPPPGPFVCTHCALTICENEISNPMQIAT